MKKLYIIMFAIIGLKANAQWQQTSLDSGYIYSFAVKGDTIFAGSDLNGIYFSSDGGGSWVTMNTGLRSENGIFAIAIKSDTLLARADGNGMNLSTNFGSSWTSIDSGLTSGCVISMAANDSNIYVGTQAISDTRGGVYASSNYGALWSQMNNGFGLDPSTGYPYNITRATRIKN